MRSGSSRYGDTAAVTGAFAASFGILAAIAFGFYWLMQPAVVKNSGLAAYKPPPKTVVSYVPWTPPPPSTEREITFAASGAGEVQSTPAIPPPKSEVATAQARANIPRQQQRRTYSAPRPMWGYAAPRQWGFRPWF